MSAAIVEFKKKINEKIFVMQVGCVTAPPQEGDAFLNGFPVRLTIFDCSGEDWIPLFKGIKANDNAPTLPGDECPELDWLTEPCKQWIAQMLFIKDEFGSSYRRSLNSFEEEVISAFLGH